MVDTVADNGADETTEPAPTPEPERLHGALVVRNGDDVVLHAERGALVELVTKLRADGFWQCIDLCAVDYLTHPGRSAIPTEVTPERFEVVVSLLNHNEARRVRIRVQVPEDDATVPTLFKLHPGTEAMEREAYDLFGITFDGHPDMSRILLPDEWHGHPLRKDHAIGKIPVQFKAAPNGGPER
ncbi:MAG TPA: NADH-quinone oxidoreductase subunit C [Microthrixaceae bacterium]|nr:NADH-quinone oxidoreductase subunit C [Microthrixaceae bacterium]